MRWVVLGALGLLLIGCGSSGSETVGPDEVEEPVAAVEEEAPPPPSDGGQADVGAQTQDEAVPEPDEPTPGAARPIVVAYEQRGTVFSRSGDLLVTLCVSLSQGGQTSDDCRFARVDALFGGTDARLQCFFDLVEGETLPACWR